MTVDGFACKSYKLSVRDSRAFVKPLSVHTMRLDEDVIPLTCGQSSFEVVLSMISLMVFCREFGSSLHT